METGCKNAIPHPQMLEALFAHRSKVSSVFRDVLGLHEIHHIALTEINAKGEILIFSSTPAMEYNLFSTPLWRHDQSYNPLWYSTLTQANWQSLYSPERYDELYYLKQIKHDLPLGFSLAAGRGDTTLIYSIASRSNPDKFSILIQNQLEDLYKIGQYCSNLLFDLFQRYQLQEPVSSLLLPEHFKHSKTDIL